MTCIDRFEKTIFSIKYHISRVKLLSFLFRSRAAALPVSSETGSYISTHPSPTFSLVHNCFRWKTSSLFFTFLYSPLYLKILKKKKRISNRFKNKVDIFFCVIEAGLALQLISNFFVLNQSLFLGLINLRQQVLWPAISMK